MVVSINFGTPMLVIHRRNKVMDPVIILISAVLVITLVLLKLMSLLKNKDLTLITKLYLILAATYLLFGHSLLHSLLYTFVYNNQNYGTMTGELIWFSMLYVSMPLSALLGIVVYIKNTSLVREFAKAFVLLIIVFPIGFILGH